ncbi:hypothetical protein SDC9_72285 [bioreactor metagenome]|uniref:PhoU domain-containing protein n=1 Tax=bioreactor metagenome TaxID=1076179 RepID=A0A644YB71_9ZZZZ
MNNELKEKREQRLNQASYELSDEIIKVKDRLDKAHLLLEEITDEYFDEYDIKDEEDCSAIIWEFSRNAKRANIIFDYVNGAIDIIDELYAMTGKAVEEKKKNIA